MSSKPRSNARKPLRELQNAPPPPHPAAGTKRTVPGPGVPEPASKRKSAIPVHVARSRRETMARLGTVGARDTASQGSQRASSLSRRQTEAGTRSNTSSFRSDASSQATSRLGRSRPANMTFTATSTASKPRGLSRPTPALKQPEMDPETIRRLTTQEAKSSALESQVQALTAMMAAVPNQAASAELSELKARLTMTEEKLQAAEKEILEKTNLLHKAEMDFKIKDLSITNKTSEMERSVADERRKAEATEHELSKLRSELEESRSSVQDAQASLQAKEIEFASLKAESSTFDTRIKNLEESLEAERALVKDIQRILAQAKEAERLSQKKFNELQTEAAQHKQDSEALEKSTSELRGEITALEAHLVKSRMSLDAETEEKERLQKENASMKEKYEHELGTAKRKYEEMEGTMTERCQSLDGTSTRLEQSLAAKTAEAGGLKSSLSAQVSAMAILKSEKDVLGVQKDALETDCRAKQEALARLEAELEEKRALIDELEEQAREDQKLRRKLHNAVQELKGNIRVFCRVRPFLDGEASEEAEKAIAYTERNQGISLTQPLASKRSSSEAVQNWDFKFDHVFGPQSAQTDVFSEISELVQSALDGYRVSIFAYGQTGSGKTHTMLGGGDGEQLGMIPRSVQQVFETAGRLAKDQWEFSFRAAFVEIYNETVRDLLVKGAGEKSLTVKFNTETRQSEVVGLTVEDVASPEKILALIARSQRYRATASTQANERSSRSHSVFRLFIEGRNALSGQKLSGLLNLVDLAGSERLNHSRARGERLKETQHINKSLSALGDVIAALANKEKHIPFRNSKLTFLLQDSLGGDSKTLMFVNVSPVLSSFNESLCSLRFAAKVNACDIGTARKTTKIEF